MAFTISHRRGYARRPHESKHPERWRGLTHAWAPALGPTGTLLVDLGGRNKHGTLTSMDPATDWVVAPTSPTGRYALDFDGSDDYVSIPQYYPTTQGSMVVALKRNTANRQRVVGGADAFEFEFDASNRPSNEFFAAGGTVLVSSTGITDTTDWHHIVCTWNFNSGAQEIYLEGVFDVAGTDADDDPGGPFELRIGHRAGTTLQWFNGQIAYCLFYDRVITAQEVAADYRAPLGLFVPFKRYAVKLPSSGVSGTVAATLGALTVSSAGTVPITGTSTPTLGALTSSSAGTVPITGTSTPTLGALTLSSAGTVPITGTSTPTLGALTVSSAGTVSGADVNGTLSETLGALTVSSAGTVPITGTSTPTLGALTVSSAGTVPITGTSSITLDAITTSADGTVAIQGDLDATLGAVSLSAEGSVDNVNHDGTVAATLGALTVSSAGTVPITGSLAATLGTLTCLAANSESITYKAGSISGPASTGTITSAGQSATIAG